MKNCINLENWVTQFKRVWYDSGSEKWHALVPLIYSAFNFVQILLMVWFQLSSLPWLKRRSLIRVSYSSKVSWQSLASRSLRRETLFESRLESRVSRLLLSGTVLCLQQAFSPLQLLHQEIVLCQSCIDLLWMSGSNLLCWSCSGWSAMRNFLS